MTTITIDALSADSLSKAADRVRKYARAIANKNHDFVKDLAKVGTDEMKMALSEDAQPGFPNEQEDMPSYNNPHVLSGGEYGKAQATLKLSGPNALFVEFGAGVYHNGPVGSSPHPLGTELGYTIGSYGQGHGKDEYWHYTKDGNEHISHGTKALMPMWRASQAIRQEAKAKAKSSFNIKGI